MLFFEKTKDFDLEKHFDPKHPDVRVRIRELFERTKDAVARERKINLEVVLLIGCLEVKMPLLILAFSREKS